MTTDKRMPVQMWATVSEGRIGDFYETEEEAKSNRWQWAKVGIEATVEPVTIHFGHEIEGARDA